MRTERFTMFDAAAIAFTFLVMLFCLLPMALVAIVSFTSEASIQANGYSFFPEEWSIAAYRLLFVGQDLVGNAYLISTFVTAVGTGLAVVVTGMAGYALANRNAQYRNGLALFFFVTMVFNPGLVPWYYVTGVLGLRDNLAALIVPRLLFQPFYLFLVRNFMQGIPDSLMESARIDGARDLTIAFRIYFPLSIPVLAAITLFYGLQYWNDWFNAIMLIDDQQLYPVQYLLFKLQSELQMLRELQQASTTSRPPTESFKMATAVVTIGPIVFFYPFLQRYFVKGLVIGSIKG
jgi:putative aldouronate transport system permease protein